MKKIIGLLAFCSAVALVSSPAQALVTVAAGGGADYTTIQAGLDAAAVGEEVQVTDGGTYAEALNINGEVLTSVPAGATINSGGNGAIIWGDLDATIDGFIITAAANGVHVDGSPADVQIMNCTINATGSGINLGAGTSVVNISNCTIAGVFGVNFDTGVGTTANITDCTITATNHGVLCNSGENSIINVLRSTITGTAEHGITLFRSATVTIADSSLINSGQCGIIADGSDTGVDRVVTMTNTQINNNGSSMALHRIGVYSFTGCQINGNGIVTGDGNWQGGFFMDGTSAGSTLNLTNTTISNNVNRGLFTGRPITLNMDGCTVSGNGGWGVLVDDYSNNTTDPINLTITNSTFTDNGGLDLYMLAKGTDTVATVTDCTFSGDTTHLNSEANNSPSGKTILAVIERNTILGGTPASLTFLSAGSKVVNNLFEQGGTSLYVANSAVDVYQNTFVGTTDGNGISVGSAFGKAVNIKNNIIAGFDTGILGLYNDPTDDPDQGMVYPSTGLENVAIQNNLILAVTAEGDVTIAPLLGVTNILGVSPDFLSASDVVGAGNYHLSDTSPALGRGAALGVIDDLDEGSRPLPAGSAPDLGAYENALVPVEISNFMID